MATNWLAEAQAINSELVERRRDFHRHPELAFQEVRTAGIVAKALADLGLEVQTGIGQTGVVGVLDGEKDGPTVLLRCDMDALPINEANSTEYNSETPGKMHACGHDGHTAIALGVARLLSAKREQISGRIKFVFQPAEEIASGARAMIKDGVLKDPNPQVSVGLHLWNDLPFGNVAVTDGPSMAGADIFRIVIKGSGGHAASPAQTRDPVAAGAQIVSALQTIVSRNVSGLDTAVVSVTMFHAGDADNVIPNEARLGGTFRTFKPEIHDLVARRIREITQGIAGALGCEAEVETSQVTPPLNNDLKTNARLRSAFGQIDHSQPLVLHDDVRTMAAEDMAEFLNAVPGSYIFVGSANAERGLNYPHHHPRFDFDERALPLGVALLCTAVSEYVLPEA